MSPVRKLAAKLCDAARKKKPASRFFIGDPPCSLCVEKAKKLLRHLPKGKR